MLLQRKKMRIVVRFRVRMHKNKPKTDPHFIYCRLRVNGVVVRSDMATGVSCLPHEWDSTAQSIRGYSDTVRNQNAKLQKFRDDLDEIYNTLRYYEKPITAEIIKQAYLRKGSFTPQTLLVYYQKYLEEHQLLRIAKDTMDAWQSRKNVLTEYIERHLKRKDIDLLETTPKWANEYYKYHITTLRNSKSHAARAVTSIKSVLNYAVIEEALPSNPLLSLRTERSKPKPIVFLTEAELAKVEQCPYLDERLQRVADSFILQCYTGMAYNELRVFNKAAHIKADSDGTQWLIIYRGKTGTLCRVPLLANARTILEKYDYKPPVVSGQKMNEYLKEIAVIAQLEQPEKLTTHVGRRTMGTYLLNKGVPLVTVGHSSTQMTERHYAERLTSTIKNDLRNLF